VAALRQAIVAHFDKELVEGELLVPYDRQSLLGQVHESARVVTEEYDEHGARLKVLADPATLARLERALAG
jgi:GTP-binding protein HflX